MQKMKELTTQEAFNKAAACCSGAEYCLSEDRDMIVRHPKEAGQMGTRCSATERSAHTPPSGKIHRRSPVQPVFRTGQIQI